MMYNSKLENHSSGCDPLTWTFFRTIRRLIPFGWALQCALRQVFPLLDKPIPIEHHIDADTTVCKQPDHIIMCNVENRAGTK